VTARVVDDGRIDVVQRTVNLQARTFGRADDLAAQARVALDALQISMLLATALLLTGLSGLTEFLAHDFAFVANAFALVGLGRAQVANLRGDLPDALLVDSLDVDLGRALERERDAVRSFVRDGCE
jgi:hypothetical protein